MQNLQQLYLLEMQKQFDSSKLSKSIQIKGMKGLSLPYIQRFFSHAGQVEQVKKIQDLVIVRFKNQASINKALRFNGRVIDRQPIKIRGATPYLSLQQMPHKKINTAKENSKKNQQIDEMIKNRAFDVPFLWANILKIISKLQDDKIMWLIHEIFFLKLSQIIHFHAFGTNARSTYAEITIKQNFVNETKNNINLAQIQGKIQKLQIISIPSNDLLDEPNFECFLSNVDTRLKLKFREIFKAIQGDRLHDLYLLFHAYSLYIPADQSIFSNENNLSNSPFSVSKQLITERRARISLQDGRYIHKRSQYRQIDNNHPSKQIQILSDAKLNQNSYQYTTYDIFRDDFDGNISNNCAADIFFHFRIHFVPNYIIVRYRQSGRLHYFRLDFELRLLNCHDQVIPTYDFCTFMEYQSSGQIKKLTQIKLLKHNLVISDYQKTQKAIYLLQNYIKYVMPNHHHQHQPQQHQNQQNIISIFLILSNESEQKLQQIKQLAKQVFSHQGITSIQNKLYVINIHDTDKFQKFKCCNFIEEYVDQQKGTFNLEIARAHAKKLIQENPSKFQLGFNAQQFTTQIIWKLQQQKSKRSAKNRIKMQVQNVRNK